MAFLDELLVLFGYRLSSGSALLDGTLPLRYCVTRFAHKVPTWKLHARGGVADLVDPSGGASAFDRAGSSSSGSGRAGGGSGLTGPGYKRVRLRTPVHEVFRKSLGINLGRVFGRDCMGIEDDDAGGRQLHDHLDFGGPAHDRKGIG